MKALLWLFLNGCYNMFEIQCKCQWKVNTKLMFMLMFKSPWIKKTWILWIWTCQCNRKQIEWK